MTISVFSVIMSLVCSSIILFSASFLVAHARRVRWGLILLIFMLGFARLILPVESWTAKIVRDWRVYPRLQALARSEVLPGISVAQFLLLLWGIGIGCMLVLFLYRMRELIRVKNQDCDAPQNAKLLAMADRVAAQMGYQGRIRIAVTRAFTTAVSVGVTHPIILVPGDMLDYPELELTGVIRHELTHYLRGDVVKQWILNIIQSLFWWNPVIHYLKRCVVEMLELECDERACRGMSEEEKLAYLSAIQRVLKAGRKKDPELGMGYGKNHNAEFLRRRFCEVLEPVERHSNRATYCLALISILLFCLSYSFIVQPAGMPKKMEDKMELGDSRDPDGESEFLLKLSDGTYLYISGMKSKGQLTNEDIQKSPYIGLPIFDSTKGE